MPQAEQQAPGIARELACWPTLRGLCQLRLSGLQASIFTDPFFSSSQWDKEPEILWLIKARTSDFIVNMELEISEAVHNVETIVPKNNRCCPVAQYPGNNLIFLDFSSWGLNVLSGAILAHYKTWPVLSWFPHIRSHFFPYLQWYRWSTNPKPCWQEIVYDSQANWGPRRQTMRLGGILFNPCQVLRDSSRGHLIKAWDRLLFLSKTHLYVISNCTY